MIHAPRIARALSILKERGSHRLRLRSASICLSVIVICAFAAPSLSQPAASCSSCTLMRLGLDAETLAIARLNTEHLGNLVAAIPHHQVEVDRWRVLDEELEARQRQLLEVQRQAETVGVTANGAARIDSARAAAEIAATAEAAARAEVIDGITQPLGAALGSASRANLRLAAANTRRRVPAEYRVLSLDASQWGLLEAAYARRQAGQLVLPPPEEQLLSWADQQSSVLQARANHQQCLASLQEAFGAVAFLETRYADVP